MASLQSPNYLNTYISVLEIRFMYLTMDKNQNLHLFNIFLVCKEYEIYAVALCVSIINYYLSFLKILTKS